MYDCIQVGVLADHIHIGGKSCEVEGVSTVHITYG